MTPNLNISNMLLYIDPDSDYKVLASLYTLMPSTTRYVCILSLLFLTVTALPYVVKGVHCECVPVYRCWGHVSVVMWVSKACGCQGLWGSMCSVHFVCRCWGYACVKRVGVLGPVRGGAEYVSIESAWSWMHAWGCQMNSCEHVHHEESVSAKLGILSCTQNELKIGRAHVWTPVT